MCADCDPVCKDPIIFSPFFRTRTLGPGAQSALRALARSGMKIGRIGKLKLSTHNVNRMYM